MSFQYDVINLLQIYSLPVSVISVVAVFLISKHRKKTAKDPIRTKTKSGFYGRSNEYKPPDISPINPEFVWDKTPAAKSYPFKDAEYKLTMGIKKLDPSEWLLIEPTYAKHIQEKTMICNNNHPKYGEFGDLTQSTIFAAPECVPAIMELYDMVIDFLVKRYPMYFKIEGDEVHNLITGEKVPLKADTSDTKDSKHYLHTLVRTVEEDFIILLKDPDHQKEEDEYYFKGGIFGFAAGFDPYNKFNKPMTAIHQPIPGYESKMKVSMNRFFNRISAGQFVTRSNFSVQTHDLFFVHDRNKGYNRPKDYVVIPKKEEDLDFDTQVFYRSERQTLTRLPKSGAVVFSIRTYLLPMSYVKSEGKEVSDRLAGAIEKLPEDIRVYKNGDEWSDAVASYLRRDSIADYLRE